MDIMDLLSRNWEVLSSAPLAFLVALIAGGLAGYALAKAHFKGLVAGKSALAEAIRERLEAAQEEVVRLQARDSEARQEIGFLFGRLTTHGEAIEEIRNEVTKLPRLTVSDRPPGPYDIPTPGSLWAVVGGEKGGEGAEKRDRG